MQVPRGQRPWQPVAIVPPEALEYVLVPFAHSWILGHTKLAEASAWGLRAKQREINPVIPRMVRRHLHDTLTYAGIRA